MFRKILFMTVSFAQINIMPSNNAFASSQSKEDTYDERQRKYEAYQKKYRELYHELATAFDEKNKDKVLAILEHKKEMLFADENCRVLALRVSAQFGLVDYIKEILSRYESIDGSWGFPAAFAAAIDHMDIIQYWLPKLRYYYKKEPIFKALEAAAAKGNIRVIEYLFEAAINNFEKDPKDDKYYFRVLSEAARFGQLEMIKKLLEHEKFALLDKTFVADCLFSSASSGENIEIMNYILDEAGVFIELCQPPHLNTLFLTYLGSKYQAEKWSVPNFVWALSICL